MTLLTIKLKAYILNASFDKKILICLSVWAVPLATSKRPSARRQCMLLKKLEGTTAVAMKQMKPVSGNWCWISAEKTTLRYALGHGWRFGIIIITICIYIYVFVYMRKRLSYLQETSRTYSYDYGRDLHDLSTRLENQDYKDPSSPQPMLVDEEAPAPGSSTPSSTPAPPRARKHAPGLPD